MSMNISLGEKANNFIWRNFQAFFFFFLNEWKYQFFLVKMKNDIKNLLFLQYHLNKAFVFLSFFAFSMDKIRPVRSNLCVFTSYKRSQTFSNEFHFSKQVEINIWKLLHHNWYAADSVFYNFYDNRNFHQSSITNSSFQQY